MIRTGSCLTPHRLPRDRQVRRRHAARALFPALAAAAIALGAASAAAAQASSSQPATSSIAVLQPIALTKTADLSFGTVVRPASGSGNVIIDATTGARTVTGGVATLTNGPGAPISRAAFTVGGEGGQSFTVNVPASFNMTLSGQNPMPVTLNATMGGGVLSGALGSAGSAAFGIGGQVTISSGTPSGAYSGSFTVTVAYN